MDGSAGEGAGNERDEGDENALDIHDLIEAMGAHFHEHHADIVRWPWKLFCRKWARLMDWAGDEEERREQERIDREMDRLRQELRSH